MKNCKNEVIAINYILDFSLPWISLIAQNSLSRGFH